MRTPAHIPNDVLEAAAHEYIREVRRMRRAEIRASITERAPDEEPLTLTEDEIETYVDVIEALVKVAGYDQDKIYQLIDELEPAPDGQLYADQVLLSLESHIPPRPPRIDDATLNQYHFEVTGKILTRCKACRRGRYWTEHEFMHPVILRRLLLYPAPCLDCHTGQIKVYGVQAVRRDSVAPENLEPATSASEVITTAQGIVYTVAPKVRERQRAKTKGTKWRKKR